MITKKSRRSLNIFEKMIVQTVCLACMSSILFSCAPASTTSAVHEAAPAAANAQVIQENLPQAQQAGPEENAMLPVRFQKPSYLVKGAEMDQGETAASQDTGIKVGADISSPTPMTLRDILKILAEEKGMTISWASDVDQNLKVDVGIGATDDFSRSLENLLRQVDYFHEIEGSTIVVKYMETRNFHLAMPPRITGADASAASSSSSVTVEDSSSRWQEIQDNLTQMLARWEKERPALPTAAAPDAGNGAPVPAANQANAQNTSTIVTVDRSIGLITVTAPLRILKKVDSYLENFKKELYRQVSIEAKIVEVTLNDTASTGINWSSLVKNKNVTVSLFEGTGVLYPTGLGRKAFSQAVIDPTFNLVVNAIQEYGDTKVLSNPKISVMNGQPAVIYVGESIRYISEVTTTVSDSGIPTYSTSTADAISGLRFEIVPNIVNDKEIIMSLIPTISGVKLPIPERQVGTTTVGLPEIKQRTMNSIVRIGNGEMLVVGGLIDDTNDEQQSKVPILGDLPFIKKAFNSTTKTKIRKELIILLRPSII